MTNKRANYTKDTRFGMFPPNMECVRFFAKCPFYRNIISMVQKSIAVAN